MGRAVVYFIRFGELQEGDADGTFVVSVTPGQGADDAAAAAATAPTADGDGATASGDGATTEEPAQDADDLTNAAKNEGVQEFDEEGREVTGDKQAQATLDGGTVLMVMGVAAAVAVAVGVAAYAAYLRPKRARQASAAAAAAAAAAAPNGPGRRRVGSVCGRVRDRHGWSGWRTRRTRHDRRGQRRRCHSGRGGRRGEGFGSRFRQGRPGFWRG